MGGAVCDADPVASLFDEYGAAVLSSLLKDRTTRRNIIWVSGEYEQFGSGFAPYDEITSKKITGQRVIVPRVVKSAERRAQRAKEKAEIFTPSWICKKMNDQVDDGWFKQVGLADSPKKDEVGLTSERIELLADKDRWKEYIDRTMLEITCGEAPFVCSPYDATTGDFIPLDERIGFLDRKLRVVKRYTDMYEDWFKWARRSVESSYGYELLGDSLLVARINVFNTFADYMADAWGKTPDKSEARQIARVISWNFWQMDGLKECVPTGRDESGEDESPQECLIYDWRSKKSQTLASLKSKRSD